MKKIEIAQNKTLKVEKKVKIGRKEGKHIVAAEWFDGELRKT